MSYFCKVYLCKGKNTDGMGYCGDHTNPIRANPPSDVVYLPREANKGYILDKIDYSGEECALGESTDYDDLSKDLKDQGVSRCMGCYFFVCKCASGLKTKSLLDDPTEKEYDNE